MKEPPTKPMSVKLMQSPNNQDWMFQPALTTATARTVHLCSDSLQIHLDACKAYVIKEFIQKVQNCKIDVSSIHTDSENRPFVNLHINATFPMYIGTEDITYSSNFGSNRLLTDHAGTELGHLILKDTVKIPI